MYTNTYYTMEKRALLIRQGNDADLILHDGSYAFFWAIDGLVKCDLHQGRIERALTGDDKIEDVANEICDKQYYQEWNQFTLQDVLINEAIEWLCVGSSLKDFSLTVIDNTEANPIDFNEVVNTFLNLK